MGLCDGFGVDGAGWGLLAGFGFGFAGWGGGERGFVGAGWFSGWGSEKVEEGLEHGFFYLFFFWWLKVGFLGAGAVE